MKQLFILLATTLLLTSCQTPNPDTQNTPEHHASLKTNASSLIYLNPLPKKARSVYINVINSADTDSFDLEKYMTIALEKNKFAIVNNQAQANIVLRANLLRVGNVSNSTMKALLSSQFGNSISQISLLDPTDENQSNAGDYVIVIDLQVFERIQRLTAIDTEAAKQPSDTAMVDMLRLNNTANWERHTTRIVSSVKDIVNLDQAAVLARQGEAITKASENIIKG
jgi:hypothetical protein